MNIVISLNAFNSIANTHRSVTIEKLIHGQGQIVLFYLFIYFII